MKPLKKSVTFLILVSLMSFVASITAASGAPLKNDIYLPIIRKVAVPTAGENYVNPIDGATYLHIPAGEFIMGSEDGPSDESPQHTVNLDEYWIMETEVTNAQYKKFMEAGGYTTEAYWSEDGWSWLNENNFTEPRYWHLSPFNSDQQPVVGVTWYEAEAYTNWLSAESGLNFRLPTEAQWEKAARGTDGRIYPWGDEWDGSKVNARGSNDVYEYTAPVGRFPAGASPYGVLDMAGNVEEWVADWYDADYYADSSRDNPTGPESGQRRVLRGGSWYRASDEVRTAYRDIVVFIFLDELSEIGFRVSVR